MNEWKLMNIIIKIYNDINIVCAFITGVCVIFSELITLFTWC